MIVELTQEEWEKATKFGKMRTDMHRGTNHTPYYASKRFKISGKHQDALGVACEFAVVKALGLDPRKCGWVPFSTNKQDFKTPDILGFIEVRRVTESSNPFTAFSKDAVEGVVLVKAYVPGADVVDDQLVTDGYVELLGWEYATDVWRKNDGEKARSYAPGKPIEALGALVGAVAA